MFISSRNYRGLISSSIPGVSRNTLGYHLIVLGLLSALSGCSSNTETEESDISGVQEEDVAGDTIGNMELQGEDGEDTAVLNREDRGGLTDGGALTELDMEEEEVSPVNAPDLNPIVPEDDAVYLFDEAVLRDYELIVDEADWAWLNENPLLEEYVPATLIFEGQEYGPIGVRYKGEYGTLDLCVEGGEIICSKLSIKLKFNEYDEEGRFYGVKRLNFHGMMYDDSQLRDRLAYTLYGEMDVFAPRSVSGRLTINGEFMGLYAVVEQVDGRFTRARFPDGGEGNLYKEVWPVHVTEAPYISALKTNEDEEPSAERMVRFASDLLAAEDDTFESTLSSWMDVDMLMRQMAVDRAIDHWDGIVGWYCLGAFCFNHNYYWYEETNRDQVWLIPWDMDNTFQNPSPIREFYGMPDWNEDPQNCTSIPVFFGIYGLPPSCDDLIHRMATVLWDRYVEETQVLLDGPFSVAAMEEKLNRWAEQIAETVTEDDNGPGQTLWLSAVEQLRIDIPELRQRVLEQIQ
jgi:hypothetical protein